MKGVGGPLLCIGDLLSDVQEEDTNNSTAIIHEIYKPSNSLEAVDFSGQHIQPSELTKLYQDNYKCLTEALGSTGHSWTTLTLELCSALETANKLVESTNYPIVALSEKIGELERIAQRGDIVIREAKIIDISTSHMQQNTTTTHD